MNNKIKINLVAILSQSSIFTTVKSSFSIIANKHTFDAKEYDKRRHVNANRKITHNKNTKGNINTNTNLQKLSKDSITQHFPGNS